MGRAGTGTVLLGHEAGFWERGRGQGIDLWVPALSRTPKFLAIAEARRVFDLIQREQERVREAATGRG